MRLMILPDWRRTWLLLGVAIGLLALIAYKAAERYLSRDLSRINAFLRPVAFEGASLTRRSASIVYYYPLSPCF
jgi:hypothetical protein